MSDRLQAAAGLRKALELWPRPEAWCKFGFLFSNGSRCLSQAIAEGLGGDSYRWIYPGDRPALFDLAGREVLNVAARFKSGKEVLSQLCDLNNDDDTTFDKLKGWVETAAQNLEQVQ